MLQFCNNWSFWLANGVYRFSIKNYMVIDDTSLNLIKISWAVLPLPELQLSSFTHLHPKTVKQYFLWRVGHRLFISSAITKFFPKFIEWSFVVVVKPILPVLLSDNKCLRKELSDFDNIKKRENLILIFLYYISMCK